MNELQQAIYLRLQQFYSELIVREHKRQEYLRDERYFLLRRETSAMQGIRSSVFDLIRLSAESDIEVVYKYLSEHEKSILTI